MEAFFILNPINSQKLKFMAIENYFERFRRIDSFIRRKSTGTPKQFARKLGVSERTLFNYLRIMKLEGAKIEYSEFRRSYYYSIEGWFHIGYLLEELIHN